MSNSVTDKFLNFKYSNKITQKPTITGKLNEFLTNKYVTNLIKANVIDKEGAKTHFITLLIKSRGKIISNNKNKTDTLGFALLLTLRAKYEKENDHANLNQIYIEMAKHYYSRDNPYFSDYLRDSVKEQLDCLYQAEINEVWVTATNTCRNCNDVFNPIKKVNIEEARNKKVIPYINCKNRLYPNCREGWCTCKYDSLKGTADQPGWVAPRLSKFNLRWITIFNYVTDDLPRFVANKNKR